MVARSVSRTPVVAIALSTKRRSNCSRWYQSRTVRVYSQGAA